MRLTRRQIDKYKIEIHQLCRVQPIIFENGTFEINGISESDKNSCMNRLRRSPLIKYVDATKEGKYNFNKFNFNRGFAEPESIYCIRGMINEPNAIDEKIEIHQELNPKLWDKNNELLPEVKEAIEKIADKFKEEVEDKDGKIKIVDVYIIGSNANYNYTENSDVDLHIIADESFDCEDNHLPVLYNAFKSIFNNKYDINIKDIPVEVYVENKDDINNISTGLYSLKNGWIKQPVQEELPKIDKVKLETEVAKWEDRYLKLIENPTIDSIAKYIEDIYEQRASSVKERNEFALGNLIFKEIRNLGYLDNLKDLKVELESNDMSVE